MEFALTREDAEILRHLASVEPAQARAWLQDNPEVTRRMSSFPPEIRVEICRILFDSFTPEQRESLRNRSPAGSVLLDQLRPDE